MTGDESYPTMLENSNIYACLVHERQDRVLDVVVESREGCLQSG